MKKIITLFFALLLIAGTSWGQSVIIGTGTSTTDGSTYDPVERYYNYEHYQIIYTAAELTAAGMPTGAIITALGFSISESAVSLANYTIKMGLTSQTIAQPYISALTTVKPAFTYTPVVQAAGSFDMIPFATNFVWDGTSSIVVNTCTGSNPFTSPYGGLRYTASTSGMITYVRTDGSDNCANTSLSSTTYRPNIQFNYTAPVPCSGTPAPGNTVSDNNPVCSGVNFNLSLQNSTSGTGVTYQWQSSPDGTTWTNVGTSTSSYPTSQTVATYYRCQVTCSGNTGTSNPLLVTMNPFTNCFCTSSANYTADEDIFNVTVGALNNTSTCSTLAPGPGSVMNEYSNYYGYVTAPLLSRTSTQAFSVQIGTCGGNYTNSVKIFIDYNQNGSFADAGEEVYVSPAGTSGPHTETGSFIIPATAAIGNTMMRVVNVETSTPSSISSCGTYGWGETEDYQVTIVDVPGVTTDPATAITGTAATLNATVSANGVSTTVTFEYGTMSGPPFDHTVTLPAPVTNQNISVNTGISSLQPNTTYYFRALGNNAYGTTNGSVLSFATLAVAPDVTTQDATIVGATFATLNGTATAFNANTAVSFEYGLTTAYAGGPVAAIPPTVTGNTPTNFNGQLTGLVINTTYHYRAIGVNIGGTTYGADKTFFTTCVVPPTPGAITGPALVCKNNTGYTYSVATVPYGFLYNWTFPAGFTISSYPHSNVVTVDIAPTAVSGTVTVIAVSDCGAPSTASTMSVTVNELPVPTVAGNATVCPYASYNYTTQAGMTNYVWTVTPNGTITPTANPNVVSISWTTPGTKTVGVVYTNPATTCTAASPGTEAVTVQAPPTPTISGTNSLCINTGYYDYTTQAGMTGYVWTVSSGGTITSGQGTAVAQVVWNTPGTQYVTVNYNNAGGCYALNPTSYSVSVNGIPGAAGSISGTSNVCSGSTGIAYSVPAITNAVAYVWSLPAGATIASGNWTNSITVNFAANAVSGAITVYGNSLCGNGAVSSPFNVTVNQLPSAAGTITGAAAVCTGQSGVPYSVAPVAGATGYAWTLPPRASIATGANTPNITVNFDMSAASGNISVHGTNLCGNGIESPEFAVTVNQSPDAPMISANGDTLTSNVTTGNQWYYEGAPILTGTGQTLVAHYTGWYWDKVTVDGCTSDTSSHLFVIVTGIGEPVGSNFIVYPVPNDGQFKLSMNTPTAQTFNISISNNLGVCVYKKENVSVNGQTDLTIDLRPVSAGIYTLVIRNSENKIIRKIVVNR